LPYRCEREIDREKERERRERKKEREIERVKKIFEVGTMSTKERRNKKSVAADVIRKLKQKREGQLSLLPWQKHIIYFRS
jgi:uncharacterized Ntn-hydrolase superfamily protein